MIKSIQLRGISRSPSDIMTEDGGVAESVNAILVDGETAPAIPAIDRVGSLGLPLVAEEGRLRALYIHKINGTNLYIYAQRYGDRDRLVAYPGAILIHDPGAGSNEYVKDESVAAIGNTLSWSMTTRAGYALWRGESYEYLGEAMPVPKVAVEPLCYKGTGTSLYSNVKIYSSDNAPDDTLFKADALAWSKQLELSPDARSDSYKKITSLFWEGMQKSLLGSKYFRCPVYVRFALKLVDGSYVRHTVPILVGARKRCFSTTLKYTTYSSDTTVDKHQTSITIEDETGFAYRIKIRIDNAEELQKWRDVVSSVDMYISEQMIYPSVNSDVVSIGSASTSSSSDRITTVQLPLYFQDDISSEDEQHSVESILLEASRVFFKVNTYSTDNLSELANGVEIDNTKDLSYTENLYTKENLTDDFRSNNDYLCERAIIFNRRLHAIGAIENFGRGMQYTYNLVPTTEATQGYTFVYELKDNDGKTRYVYSRDELHTPTLQGRTIGAAQPETTWGSDIAQLLFYPDTRCVAVWVKHGNAVIRLEMKSHPFANMSYWIGDISKTLSMLTYSTTLVLPQEDRVGISYLYNYLFVSSADNPYYFPVGGRIKFTDNLKTVATITTALSEGQFGQFDLYAFTDAGVYVLSPNDKGEYLTLKPLSRDVCLSADSVACLDRAICFITKKGVMLMDGSTIQCISERMVGRQVKIEEDVSNLIASVIGSHAYDDIVCDDNPFMDFMLGASIAYDYTGSRLIFFRDGYTYEYVYMLKTATWHKIVLPIQLDHGITLDVKVLNSFPDCFTFVQEGGRMHLYDWSTVLDETDDSSLTTSIIVTRPFVLDASNILKSITDLRIRGNFEHFHSQLVRHLRCLFCNDIEKIKSDVTSILATYGVFVTEEQVVSFLNADDDLEVAALPASDAEYMLMMLNNLDAEFGYVYLAGNSIKAVQYALLASQDGVHYTLLKSLRGKSWKMFRIVIIARLSTKERLSWIDVDYELRGRIKMR